VPFHPPCTLYCIRPRRPAAPVWNSLRRPWLRRRLQQQVKLKELPVCISSFALPVSLLSPLQCVACICRQIPEMPGNSGLGATNSVLQNIHTAKPSAYVLDHSNLAEPRGLGGGKENTGKSGPWAGFTNTRLHAIASSTNITNPLHSLKIRCIFARGLEFSALSEFFPPGGGVEAMFSGSGCCCPSLVKAPSQTLRDSLASHFWRRLSNSPQRKRESWDSLAARGGLRRTSPSCHDRQCRVPLVQSYGRTLL
jgi:hypothetical protein